MRKGRSIPSGVSRWSFSFGLETTHGDTRYHRLMRRCENSGNTTHGSGWIVQAQPTNEGGSTASLNPTHGSGWIVQAQPTKKGDCHYCFCISLTRDARREKEKKNKNPGALLCRLDLNDPPTPVGGIRGSRREAFVCRLDLNDPPTPVGGIRGSRREAFVCRLDLNDPPTSVGGIPRVFGQSLKPDGIADRLEAAIMEVSRILMPEVSAG
jgi:hypothetical protein